MSKGKVSCLGNSVFSLTARGDAAIRALMECEIFEISHSTVNSDELRDLLAEED